MVYYAPIDGLRALAADSGQLLWRFPVNGSGYILPPVVAGGLAYIAMGGHNIPDGTGRWFTLWALDARSGAVRWKANFEDAIRLPFFVSGGTVYTIAPKVITARRSGDGTVLWVRTVASRPRGVGQAAIAGDTIYLGIGGLGECSGTPYYPAIAAVRASDGALLWYTFIHASFPTIA